MSVKKGLLKGELGTLVIQAEQPRSLRLPKSYNPEETNVSTVAVVKLRFDLADAKSKPPRLGSLSSELMSTTFHTTIARRDLPKKEDVVFNQRQGSYSVNLGLSSRQIDSGEWLSRTESTSEVEQLARRESSLPYKEISKYLSPSTNYKGQNFWTADIVVSVALPKNKQFVPTFHSCLVSRIYSLNLSLGVYSAGIDSPIVKLKLPLQISAEGKGGVDVTTPSPALVKAQSAGCKYEDELLAAEHRGSWPYDGLETLEAIDLPPGYEA